MKTMTLRCHTQTAWAVQAGGVLLIRSDTGATVVLDDGQSTIWDLLSRQTPYARIISIICAVHGVGEVEAERMIETAVQSWLIDGWLVEGNTDG